MHYTRKITSTETAVKEAKEWLGDKRFALLIEVMQGSTSTRASRLRTLYFLLPFSRDARSRPHSWPLQAHLQLTFRYK